MYNLPDCPEKRRLITYLEKKIKECDEKIYIEYGTREGKEYIGMERAYRDILERIR